MDVCQSCSVSADYKNMPIPMNMSSTQRPQQLFVDIVHYERVKNERDVIQHLIRVFEQKSEEKYRAFIKRLQQNQAQKKNLEEHKNITCSYCASKSAAETPVVYASQSDPYYNEDKQKWAQQLINSLQTVISNIMPSVNRAAETPPAALTTLKTELSRLDTVARSLALTDADFTSLYNLPNQISLALQAVPRKSGETNRIDVIAKCYGTAADLTTTFAKIRISGLLDVITVAKTKLTGDENQTTLATVKTLETQLTTLKGSLSTSNLSQVTIYGESLATALAGSNLSGNDKIPLTDRISYLYRDQVNALKSYDTIYQMALSADEDRNNVFSLVSNLVTSLVGTFAPIDLGNITSEISSASLAGALQTLRAINTRYPSLLSSEQTIVNNALAPLQTMKVGEYLGAVWAYFIASTVLAMNPAATMETIKNAITAYEAEVADSQLTLVQNMATCMKNITSSNGMCNFIGVNGSSETYTIYYTANGSSTVSINSILLNRSNSQNANNAGLLLKVTQAAQAQKSNIITQYNEYQTKAAEEKAKADASLQATQQKLTDFETFTQTIYDEQLMAQAIGLKSMTLPSAVVAVLIERYMPKEVSVLNDIYSQLYYSNMGSSVGNAVLDAISQYVNAATYFTFASYIGQQPAVGAGGSNSSGNVYPGTLDSAQSKLDTERTKASAYLQETQNAIIVVDQQIKKVQEDIKLTEGQKGSIISKLKVYKDNFNSILGSLVLLQNYLAPLTIGHGTVNGTFTVNGGESQWQSRLEILEDTIISGISGNAVVGGMFSVQATVQADQQSYADTGQNYQLELQMHLTSMQQEWTVVATSLQLLNQMYLSLARSLVG